MKEDWIECTLDEVCEKALKVKRKEMPSSEKIKYLDIGGIDNHSNKIISHKDYTWADAPSRAQQIIKKDDILFSTVRTYLKNVAKVNREEYNEEIASSGFTVLRAKKDILKSDYLFFRTLSTVFLNTLNKLQRGTSYPAVRDKDVFAQIIPLPPLVEQKAIVKKIEELFSSLDSGIADLKKVQDQLVIYRQAVLKKAFEGELTKEWRKINDLQPSFTFLKDLAKQRKEAEVDKKSIYHKKISHDFSFSKDDKIETWSKGTLDKLIYIAARIGWRGLKKSEYTESGPLFLSVHSLNYGKYVDYTQAYHISEERYLESPEIKLQEGDVLLCKDGAGIGKIGIVKDLPTAASVNSSVLVIRGMNVLSQEFLYYLFSGPKLQSIVFQRITGSATPHLFQNDIKKFELSIPPIEEQHQIVQEIESRLSVCDKVEKDIVDSLEKAQALRQSILKKAFDGKLLSGVEIAKCKADKDYESASILLEKIKKEKKEVNV